MTRSVFLDRDLPPASPGDVVVVAAAVAHHVRVSRIAANEEFDLVDGSGLRLRSILEDSTAAEAAPAAADRAESPAGRGRRRQRGRSEEPLSVRVLEATTERPGDPELVLIQALAKGDRDEQAIESATEMGIDRVIPWAAARSIAAWPAHKEEKQSARWRSLLDSATQQSRRALAPELEPIARGNRVLERLLPTDQVLVLHEDATEHLADVLADWAGERPADAGPHADAGPYSDAESPVDAVPAVDAESPVVAVRLVLVVGPEGGISPEEIDALRAAGARPVLLGPTVLRASSAGPAGIALAQAALGRWRAVEA